MRIPLHHVLVYADSLTWGIIPNTRKRLPFDERWPGVLENKLTGLGHRLRVIEDCLNGRRTVWEDPFKPGRNGLGGLAQRIEMHSPLSLVILMLAVGRIIVGVGIGLSSSGVPVYISEVAPADARGWQVSLFQLAITVGILLAYLDAR